MLEAENLSYVSHKKVLLKKLSLFFEPGLIHGIVGPNGSGKSTLLKALAGIWKAATGNVYWEEKNLLTMSRKEISKVISLVPQNPLVTFDFTVEEFVKMGRYAHGFRHANEAIEQALVSTNVVQFRHRPITKLSQGERQRVYIARSLATEAPVMLFDEPMANLDIRHQIDIWKILKILALKGKVLLVANHDLASTKRYCDRIYVMHNGECLRAGAFHEVMTPEIMREVFGIQPEEPTHWMFY